MANYQLLNNIDHKDLKVIVDRSAEYGDDVWFAATFPSEFRNVQRHYPIFFMKVPEAKEGKRDSSNFQAVAMFGLEDGENLFLDEHGWHAGYIPLNVVRMPFLIGYQDLGEPGRSTREQVITIDMDSPRVNTERGEPVFLPHGGNSPYVEQVGSILKVLHKGVQRSPPFYDTLVEMNLLESFVMDVKTNDGADYRLSGFYTINEDALRDLTADQLHLLNKRGYMEAIYMAVASMSHIQDLVDRKNERRRRAAANA